MSLDDCNGRTGDTHRVRGGFSRGVISLATVDEGCTYMAAAACALIGDREGALRWFEHMIRDRGFVAWPYFADRDPFLVSLPWYEALMEEMRMLYEAGA